MKKILFFLCTLMLSASAIFSQVSDEKKLKVKELDLKDYVQDATRVGAVDCNCNNNVLKDGGFEKLSVITGGSDISASSNPWQLNTYSPQWTNTSGACNKGFVSMWGNKVVGESIYQNGLPFTPGTYTVKFTARFANPTTISTLVRLKIWAFSGSSPSGYDASGFASLNITSTNWATYSMSITIAPGQTGIVLHPENDYNKNDGAYVSWIQLDNICIEKACKIPDEKCDPKFAAAPFTVNSQGNIVINVNPAITGGAEHYWGLLGASGTTPTDNTPIPLSTILSGGSFGLHVSNTGTVTPIGMGTGITASSSGYGYHYEGVDVGKCFKITHYVKCCGKWYSQTNTYCTRLCVEVKEGPVTEISAKEAEQIQTLEATKGRG
ncbi:hypothetical protein [Ferruginibacter sp. SUN106]|uniref:hypothetical protein n=1 Tax=Ferruginibacter sp. SUN106 TaxID=2978348 RepID=UPI003D36C170